MGQSRVGERQVIYSPGPVRCPGQQIAAERLVVVVTVTNSTELGCDNTKPAFAFRAALGRLWPNPEAQPAGQRVR
jgi:hypothetical protein